VDAPPPDVDDVSTPEAPVMPWPLAAAGGALAGAASIWLVLLAIFTLAWLQVPDVGFGSVVGLATRVWLLAHGAGADLAGTTVTIAPLGITGLILLVTTGLSGFAGQQARATMPPDPTSRERRGMALWVGAWFGCVYALSVLGASFFVSNAQQSAQALLGGLVIGLGSGFLGAARAADYHPTHDWPGWARPVPRAVGVALLILVAFSASVLAVALFRYQDRVELIHDGLAPGTSGGVLLLLLQLAWLPNLVVWSGSWALGAGVGLGVNSVASPVANQIGLLPSIPVLGAVPANGPGPLSALWWLASGVTAGALAALVVLRARPRARFDETALVGGLAGVASGAVFWLVALVSGGDLGTLRLVDFGARLPQLAVMAPTLLGLSGLVTGLVFGLMRRPAPSGTEPAAEASGLSNG